MNGMHSSRGTGPRKLLACLSGPGPGNEEIFTLKSSHLFRMAALVAAALMPLAAACQVDLESSTASTTPAAPAYKYVAYIGYGYTSINQVNLSRHGLQGVDVAFTRNFAKHYGLTAEGAYYKLPMGALNPGNPSVYSILAGPEIHFPVWGPITAFAHGLLGVEHTGGENMNPATSFAGGAGGGAEWALSPHFAIRAQGDDIAASFSLINPLPGYSSHRTRSSRATFGVAYHF